MLPALWWTSRFWDALLALTWFALIGLAAAFAASAALFPNSTQWPARIAPIVTTAFVVLSGARFIAVRSAIWLVYMSLGQLCGSLLLQMRPAPVHWANNAMEHALAGAAAAIALFYFDHVRVWWNNRHRSSSHIKDLIRKRQQPPQ